MSPTSDRAAALSRSDSPFTRTLPSLGFSRPAMTRSSVVLPAPFGPNRARHSPELSVRSTPFTARRRPKRRTTPASSTAGGVEGGGMPQDKRSRGASPQDDNPRGRRYYLDMTEIDALLQENRKFAPSKEFRRDAVISDPQVYEEDPESYWEREAGQLEWFSKWNQVC